MCGLSASHHKLTKAGNAWVSAIDVMAWGVQDGGLPAKLDERNRRVCQGEAAHSE